MSRLAAALRRRHREAFAVLAVVVAVGALLICALAAQAVAVVRSGGVGDLTSVAMFVVIAGLLTAVLLRSCVDHLVTTRWGEYMRLRILGATRTQITTMMVGDLRGVTLLGTLLGAAGATLVWMPVSETLHGLDVVDEVNSLGLVTMLTATALTVLLVCACALAGVASAAWAVCRPEPALRRRDPGTRPPGRRSRRRSVRLGVAWVLLCVAAAASPSVFGVLVAVIAVVVGARAALAAMGWWWSGTGRQRPAATRRRPGWVWWWADRRTRHERRRTGATAALVATTATVFLYGGAVGRDEAATEALRDMLGPAAVLEVDGPDGAARLAGARTADGAGAALVVTDHDIAVPQSGSCAAGSVSGAGRRVVAGDLASVFAGRVVAGRLPRGSEAGVVVTATTASGDGLEPGDTVCVAEGDGWRTAPVVAVVAAPGGLGESFVAGVPASTTGLPDDTTALAVAEEPVARELAAAVPQARLTDGGRWVDALPSGKAFSASGGSGADEMVLFLLAPVVMAVTAAGAAAATRELERRGTARTLLRLGARPRQHALTAAAAQLMEVVPLLVLGAVVGLTSAAVGNVGFLREMGGRPEVTVPVDQLAAVGVGMGASVLVAGAVALGVARRLARGGGA